MRNENVREQTQICDGAAEMISLISAVDPTGQATTYLVGGLTDA